MALCFLPTIPSNARTPIISNFFPSKTLVSFRRSPKTLILASSANHLQSQHPPSPRIFIKGLSLSTNEGFLRKKFSEFGEVNEVKIARNKASQSLGYAFVSYARQDHAQLAVNEMNGKFFDGRFILVEIGRPGNLGRKRTAPRYRF
ncbi:organelle RRM domain-containing protein 1, chloroplastic isoform X1 [Nymphaea colorata]|nr:organelle RRM domain-containing protein 1, chloroplastic isoform X1 [Nymphaea colorata]